MYDLNQFIVPMIVVYSLILGYILKKWFSELDNRFIPTILAIIGAVMNVVINGLSLDSIMYGALSALSSTGLHQAFKQYIERDSEWK